jgi:hypothetical protein
VILAIGGSFSASAIEGCHSPGSGQPESGIAQRLEATQDAAVEAVNPDPWTNVPSISPAASDIANMQGRAAERPSPLTSWQLDANVAPKQRGRPQFRLNSQQLGRILRPEGESLIALPTSEGKRALFRVHRTTVGSDHLAATVPEFSVFHGQGVDDRSATVTITNTNGELRALVLGLKDAFAVDPSSGASVYANNSLSFDERKRTRAPCQRVSASASATASSGSFPQPDARIVQRRFRLAITATPEYSRTFRRAGDDDAMAKTHALYAIMNTISRVNGIYERAFNVHFDLVDKERDLIAVRPNELNLPSPDGHGDFPDDYPSQLLAANEVVLQQVLGPTAYDIGHVFATAGGGLADVGVLCQPAAKAHGASGLSPPTGDMFDVVFVAHEIGHQLGANHTFNANASYCGIPNGRHPETAFEPGSGSTIMSYTGICPPTDINAGVAADYFHTASLTEISRYLASEAVSQCGQARVAPDRAPVVSAPPRYIIPKGTPFELQATGSDGDGGDVLYYSWEELDTGSPAPPDGDSDHFLRPLFRSWPADPWARRSFPRMASLLGGATPGEALPQTTRDMHFRVTARSLHYEAAGEMTTGIATADTVVHVEAQAGPFRVTSPAAGNVWHAGAVQQVTWDVAGTDRSPISCAAVSIAWSADGGVSFGAPVSRGTPNGPTRVGLARVTAPACPTGEPTTGRLRISCDGNIFFAVSEPITLVP